MKAFRVALFICALLLVSVADAKSQARKLIPFEERDKMGYHDARGRVMIAPQYRLANEFSREGFATVLDDQGWAFIDTGGRVLVRPFIFDNGPDYFVEGLARFTLNNKIGFFDRQGRIVIPAQFDFAEPFHDHIAAACVGCHSEREGEHSIIVGGRWGYINRQGQTIVPLRYDSAETFARGRGRVKKDGKWIDVDRNGRALR